jgi:hypothetical protein
MPGKFQQGFFDLSVKREHLYALGFRSWSQFIEGEVPPGYYSVVLKIQVLPVQATCLRR